MLPEYEPDGDVLHEVAPVEDHVPAGQVIQLLRLVAPRVEELVPAGHEVHVVAKAGEYVPAGHCVIVPPKHCEPAGQASCVPALEPE